MMGPFGLFGLGILAGGLFSVVLYRRRRPHDVVTPGMGARLGAASGTFGFGLFALAGVAATLILQKGNELREFVGRAIDQAATRNPGPEAEDMVRQLKSPEGILIMLVIMAILTLVIFVVVSSLGGLLGATFLEKKEHL